MHMKQDVRLDISWCLAILAKAVKLLKQMIVSS